MEFTILKPRVHYSDEQRALSLFRKFKKGDPLALEQLLIECAVPVVQRLISARRTTAMVPADELLDAAMVRLHRGLARHYSPKKGRMFSFVTKSAQNVLAEQVRRTKRDQGRYCTLDDLPEEMFSTNGQEHLDAVDDIRHRIEQVKTVSTCPKEQDAQRWLIRNLIENNFCFRRHECADAMTVVYSIPPNRARKLFDITLLSIRRILIADRKLRPIHAKELITTRAKALLRYRGRLSGEDFSRLCYLMHGLAPAIISSGEYTVKEILWGSSREIPLFVEKIEQNGAECVVKERR
jgi:DNA-directed RNA polymerase specialized sigma24 family protein